MDPCSVLTQDGSPSVPPLAPAAVETMPELLLGRVLGEDQ